MIPLQHIHPILVHFPIVFMLTLAVFDVVAIARGASVTQRTAAGNVSTGLAVLAAVFAVVTFFFGDIALGIAESGGFSSDVAEIHEGLGTFTAVAFGVWGALRAFVWWRNMSIGGVFRALVPVAEVVGAVLVTATAFYGGQLVYDLGVNVAQAAM